MSHFLVTTPLKETWPTDNSKILFLGEWCLLYYEKKSLSSVNGHVLDYHWDDRNKLYNDYKYIQKIYEQLLILLSYQLNTIHNVDHSVRYWRILVGPWLGYFLQILFDRWSSLTQAMNSYEIDNTIILDYESEHFIPKGMDDFHEYYISDEWNHFVYGEILKMAGEVSLSYQNPEQVQIENKINNTNHNFSLKKILKSVLNNLSYLNRDNDYFFISTQLPKLLQLKLELKLNQFPIIRFSRQVPNKKPDLKKRSWELNPTNDSDFVRISTKLISKFLPTVYLEGYKSLIEIVQNLTWPKRPKAIWTSDSHYDDDVFKAWSANKIEHGSKLIIGQHGGHFGIGRWYFLEEHEISISDKYFSWGWTDNSIPKVIPVGQLKNKKPLTFDYSNQKKLLMVCLSMPRYSYHMYSVIVASQYLDYLNQQFLFVKSLKKSIQNKLIIRLYNKDYGWEQENRWKDKFPNIQLDNGKKNMESLIIGSRLYVSTYNATTYLESLTMNIPTIIFWNHNHWEIRESAKPYFEKMKKVGIFHDNPVSAARQINSVWDDVDKWWSSNEVSEVVKIFCNRFSKIYKNPLKKIIKEIKN